MTKKNKLIYKFNTYLPNKLKKKKEENLVQLGIELHFHTQQDLVWLDKILGQKLSKHLEGQLVSKIVNPVDCKHISNWVFGALKGYLGAKYDLSISVRLPSESYTKRYYNNLNGLSEFGLEKNALYSSGKDKMAYTNASSISLAHKYLDSKDTVYITTVFCPPYRYSEQKKSNVEFFDSIHLDPYTQNQWEYDYKHFLRLLKESAKKMSLATKSDVKVVVYLADYAVNGSETLCKNTNANKENLEHFYNSMQLYITQCGYDIELRQLKTFAESLQPLSFYLPYKFNDRISLLDKFSNKFKFIAELLLITDEELENILDSDDSIAEYSNKFGQDKKDVVNILKATKQTQRISKYLEKDLKSYLVRNIQKFCFLRTVSTLITKNNPQSIYFSLDTGFAFGANFIQSKDLPVFHIDPRTYKKVDYKYKNQGRVLNIVTPHYKTSLILNYLESLKDNFQNIHASKLDFVYICIIINGNDIDSYKLVLDYISKNNFKFDRLGFDIFILNEKGIGLARNFGLTKVNKGVVGLVDSDCTFINGFFSSVSKYYNDIRGKTLISFKTKFLYSNPEYPLLRKIVNLRSYLDEIGGEKTFYSVNLFFTKEQFNQVGEYDTSLLNGEDTEWGNRASLLGYVNSKKRIYTLTHTDTAGFGGLGSTWATYGDMRGSMLSQSKNYWQDFGILFKKHLYLHKEIFSKFGIETSLLFLWLKVFYIKGLVYSLWKKR